VKIFLLDLKKKKRDTNYFGKFSNFGWVFILKTNLRILSLININDLILKKTSLRNEEFHFQRAEFNFGGQTSVMEKYIITKSKV